MSAIHQIFLDTETTGRSLMHKHRVVEIGAVKCENGKVVEEFHTYINPERTVPKIATSVHGLDNAFLHDKPKFASIAVAFSFFVRDCEVIIHDAPFDRRFLDDELARLGRPSLPELASSVICSLEWARNKGPDLESYSLDALCEHYGIEMGKRDIHSAIEDARLLREIYYRMRGIRRS